MKRDFRDTVINLLFEPEEDDEQVVAEGPLQTVDVKKPHVAKVAPPKREEINVKEIIYGEKVKKPTFIDVDEKSETIAPVVNVPKADDHPYEVQPNLSPIFGVIKDERVKVVKEVVADESQVKKPRTSYLGTVLSPIFGYDSEKANEARITYQSSDFEEDTKPELRDTDITSDLYSFYDEEVMESEEEVSFIDDMISENADAEEIDLFEDLFGDKEY